MTFSTFALQSKFNLTFSINSMSLVGDYCNWYFESVYLKGPTLTPLDPWTNFDETLGVNFRFPKNIPLPIWGRKRKSKIWRCTNLGSTLYTLEVSSKSVHGTRRSQLRTLQINRILSMLLLEASSDSFPLTGIIKRVLSNTSNSNNQWLVITHSCRDSIWVII